MSFPSLKDQQPPLVSTYSKCKFAKGGRAHGWANDEGAHAGADREESQGGQRQKENRNKTKGKKQEEQTKTPRKLSI